MFKKLTYLVSFVFVLSLGITAQATPIPVSVNPAVETVIGDDGNTFPNQSYETYTLQVSDHLTGITQGRRVTLISYDISGLKSNDKQRYRNMSLSVLGFIPGNVDVYGVVEDQDNISRGVKWNNAPGVVNDQVFAYPVELDMDDLTDKLFSFTAPNRDERKSIGACQELDDFINSDTDGVVTFLLAPSKGSKFVKMWSSTYPGGGIILNGEMTLGVDIAWVTETVDRDEDGVQDDQVWTDWLVAEGYDLNLQPDRYLTLGDDKDPNDANDYVGELNTADLVIISRTASSGGYANDDNEVAAWGSVTTPIISLSAWHVRSSRLKWVLSTTVNRTLDTYLLTELTDHPIFEGVTLEDGLVEMVVSEGYADGYQGNCVIGGTDVGNGVLIGQSFSDETLIAEWPAGKEAYDGAGLVMAGPRLLFCAGTENASLSANLFPQGGWNLSDAGEMMFRNAIEYTLSLPPAGAKIVYVTSVKDQNVDGVQDNISWIDWLKARGFNVDFRPDNWVEPLDPNKVAELEAADLIIASRGMSTGSYDGDATVWNSLSTPIICTNAWMIRSNRWLWMNSSSANKDAGAPILMALETGHPIFDSVELDQDGLVEILDPDVGSGHTSFLTDILDVGNGTLLAQSLGIYNTAWIVEWPAGVEYYDGAGQVTGGPRLLFMAGTQDDPYTDDNGNIMPVDVLNLNDAGKQMFLNTIEYMLPIVPTDPGTYGLVAFYALDGDVLDSSGSGLDGTVEIIGSGNDATFVPGQYDIAIDLLPSENGTVGPYVNCGADPLFDLVDEVTVGAWVNIRSVPDEWRAIVAKGDSAWRIGNVGATTKFHFGFCGYASRPTTHGIDGAIEVGFDEWHYVCGTYDITDGAKLYVDGVLDVEVADTAGIAVNTFDVTIGANMEDTGWKPYRLFDGIIDEVRIYDRALSEAEVMYLAAPPAPVDPGADGLIAYYALDGDVLDSSGNGLDGTIMGDPTFAEGVAGMSLLTDGVDDYVDCGNDALFDITEQITLATWVNVNDFGNGENDPWINKGDHAWCIKGHRSGYAIEFFVYEGTWNWISAEVGDLNNEWHHAVGTFDGTQLKIYVDGMFVATKDYVGGIATSTHNVAIGTNTEAGGRFSEGMHDEVYIYNRALSINEIVYLAGI